MRTSKENIIHPLFKALRSVTLLTVLLVSIAGFMIDQDLISFDPLIEISMEVENTEDVDISLNDLIYSGFIDASMVERESSIYYHLNSCFPRLNTAPVTPPPELYC